MWIFDYLQFRGFSKNRLQTLSQIVQAVIYFQVIFDKTFATVQLSTNPNAAAPKIIFVKSRLEKFIIICPPSKSLTKTFTETLQLSDKSFLF